MRNQRWNNGTAHWRSDREVIDPSRYGVICVETKADIEAFIRQHHYEHSDLPSTRFRFLLVEREGLRETIVGAANFGVPVHPRVIPKVFPMIEKGRGVELNRLVLLDRVPANAESWFVSQTFRYMKQKPHGIEAVVSFSDPVPRSLENGHLVMPGHWGCVYQALSASYVGRGSSGTKRIFKSDGTSFPRRTTSKAMTGDRGKDGAVDRLVARGATPLGDGEDRREWMMYWIDKLTYPVSHPGCHKYAWALGRALRKYVPPSLPYPKVIDGRAA